MPDSYPLKPFRIWKPAVLRRVIDEYPLATLMSGVAGTAEISLIPLLLDAEGSQWTLEGHLDRNNPHSGQLVPGEPVSFVFQGQAFDDQAAFAVVGSTVTWFATCR